MRVVRQRPDREAPPAGLEAERPARDRAGQPRKVGRCRGCGSRHVAEIAAAAAADPDLAEFSAELLARFERGG
jgi:hypothetical protein